MSDKYICSESKLTGIGDAIRAKTGDSEKLTLDGMTSAIEGISSGGGAPTIDVITTGDNDSLYIDTNIDYKTDIKCAFFISSRYTKVGSSELRYLGSGIINDSINSITMIYLYDNKAYFDVYDNQLSFENNNGKLRIKSSTYKFKSKANYTFVSWDKNTNINIEKIAARTTAYIDTNIDYKYGYNCVIITCSDFNNEYNPSSYGAFAVSLITGNTKYISSSYDYAIEAYPTDISNYNTKIYVSSPDTSMFDLYYFLNNNGKLRISSRGLTDEASDYIRPVNKKEASSYVIVW